MRNIAAMAAMMVAFGASHVPESASGWPKHPPEPEPPKIKSAGNKAGSKYRNRKKRGKPLFRV